MKGQNVDFKTTIQRKEQSQKNKQIAGEMVEFSVDATKKDSHEKKSSLTGKHLDFSLDIVGSWSITEKKQTACMICKLPFKEGQRVSRCPMCQSMFHETHIFEWLKVKGKCPVCLQSLRPGGTEEVKF
jgi:hypothetical protein